MPLNPFDLRDRVLANHPGALIHQVPLRAEPGRSVRFAVERLDPATGEAGPYARDWDEIFLDPYDGKELGRRRWGDLSQGAVNLLPFVHRLHDSLAIGDWGRLTIGIAALIWVVDCFVGFYLTLPKRNRAQPRREGEGPALRKSRIARWGPAWRVRWRGAGHKRTFDVHRAGGLWLWPMLLVFAWSGVGFTLPQIYDPVMRQIGYRPIAEGVERPATPGGEPGADVRAAARHGRMLVSHLADREGLSIDGTRPSSITYYPRFGVYLYRFTSDASVASSGYGDSLVIFSARSGGLLKAVLPARGPWGTSMHAWLEALHLASVGGLPYRVLVALAGILAATLSATGVLIWTKKRSARLLTANRAPRSIVALRRAF